MQFVELDLILHIVVSLILSYCIWRLYGFKDRKTLSYALFAGIISGLLIDVDHFLDYFLVYGTTFDFFKFMHESGYIQTGRATVIFHGFEYALIGFLAIFFVKKGLHKMIVTTITFCLFFHLLIDASLYSIPLYYFLFTYRLTHNFSFYIPR